MTERKICFRCQQLYPDKDECPKCKERLKSVEEYIELLDKQFEHYRGLHITYTDPSYASDHKAHLIRLYYESYLLLLKEDYQNREKYLYGMAKTYDVFDKGQNLTFHRYCFGNLFFLAIAFPFN